MKFYFKDVQLQLESIHCSIQDQLQGVVTDSLRHAVGRDYEIILEKKLREEKIAFMDEDAQRNAGTDFNTYYTYITIFEFLYKIRWKFSIFFH